MQSQTRGRSRRSAPAPVGIPSARQLTAIAFTPSGLALALLAALILVTLVMANSDLTGASAAVAAAWLAIHQVPLTIDGTTIGVLPLLPWLALLVIVWAGCVRAAREPEFGVGGEPADAGPLPLGMMLRSLAARRVLAAAVSGPFLITTTCLAIIGDAASVLPLEPPNPLVSFACVLGSHALAAVAGMCWPRRAEVFAVLPDWVLVGARGALQAGRWLIVAGAVALTLVSLASIGQVWQTLRTPDGFVGGLSVSLLSLLYLPNVLTGAIAVLTGATFSVGGGGISVFAVTGGEVPAVPILAGLPGGPAAPWWPVLLVVPTVAGGCLGRWCARASSDRANAARATGFAALLLASAALLLAVVSGGQLGNFGYIGASPWIFALLLGAWLTIGGQLIVLVSAPAVPVLEPPPALEPPPMPPPAPVAAPVLELEAGLSSPPPAEPVVGEAIADDIIDAEVVPEAPPANPGRPGPPPLIER